MSDISWKDAITWGVGFLGPIAVVVVGVILNKKRDTDKKEFAEKLESWKAELGVDAYVKQRRYDRMEKVADEFRALMTEAFERIKEFASAVKLQEDFEVVTIDAHKRGADGAWEKFCYFMRGKGERLLEPTRTRAEKFQKDLGSLYSAASLGRGSSYGRELVERAEQDIQTDLATQLQEIQESIRADIEKGP